MKMCVFHWHIVCLIHPLHKICIDFNSTKIFDKTDRKFAKRLKRAIKFTNQFDKEVFRIHSKGYGVVCKK